MHSQNGIQVDPALAGAAACVTALSLRHTTSLWRLAVSKIVNCKSSIVNQDAAVAQLVRARA